jgi:spermidine synthase
MGEKYFELSGPGNRNLRNFVMDGRTFLRVTDRTYDLIFIDAYSQQIYIPFTMTTEEFFSMVKSRLEPGGMVSINVCEFSENSPSLSAIRSTMASVFGSVHQVKVLYGLNFLLFAGRDGEAPDDGTARLNLDHPGFAAASEQETLRWYMEYALRVKKTYLPRPGDTVLTDDHAPIEALMDRSYREVRSRLKVEKD